MPAAARNEADVARRLGDWYASRQPERRTNEVTAQALASGGYSNEIFRLSVVSGAGDRRGTRAEILRLPPPGPTLFPAYDLELQRLVIESVSAADVPVPRPVIVELDETWLGVPFMIMPFVGGHCPGELASLDPWVMAASRAQQRTLHVAFLDVLACVHRTPWRATPLASQLRVAGASMLDEVAWWAARLDWAFDGEPPRALVDAFGWCRDHAPPELPEPSLLWGDVRFGNVIFDDDFTPIAVLDWEMASIGPAEMDLAWHTALEGMGEHFLGTRVPGLLTRDQVVAHHERALGRTLVAFDWFEIFARCRATLLQLRTERLDALRLGRQPRDPGRHAVLAFTLATIEAQA